MGNKCHKWMKGLIVVATLGLITAVAIPQAHAQYTVGDYSGRYVCSGAIDFNTITGVIKYTPDGTGKYTVGSLRAALVVFGVPFDPATAATQFCNYTLDTTTSSYTINSNGTGFETLVWDASPANSTSCPASNPATSFIDQTVIALTPSNQSAQFSSANFLNQNLAGAGQCLR